MLIRIQCPNCRVWHELPDTFAGGVYRCGGCNTLMSVAADAQRLQRLPDEPAPPPSIGGHGGSDSSSRSTRGSSRSSGGRPVSGRPGAQSGRSGRKPEPAPRRNPKTLWLLVGCGAASVGLLVVLVLVLVNAGKSPPPRPPAPKPKVATAPTPAPVPTAPAEPPKLRFDPAKAPLDVTGANIAGIPLGAPTHVILDGRMTGPPRQQFEALLRETLGRSPGPKTLQLTWAGDKPVTLSATSAADLGAAKLKEWFAGNLATTTPSLEQAADEGAADTAEVVLVLAGPMSRSSAESLLNRLSRAGRSPVLHLVLLDAEAPMILRQQAEASRGACVDLGASRLASWTGSLRLEPEPMPPPTWVATASSSNGNDMAARAMDGRPGSYWHTQYFPSRAPPPHWLALDLGRAEEIRTVTLFARDSGGVNGTPKRVRLEVSDDGVGWTAAGEFDAWQKTDELGQPVEYTLRPARSARHLRVTSLQEINDGPWMSLAEIEVNGHGSP